ncbi:hypothetical protein WN48_03727 [Eufriesea mexicana]|nr:hypothetical protein WN48_03727 [Eufriesea mexicana]
MIRRCPKDHEFTISSGMYPGTMSLWILRLIHFDSSLDLRLDSKTNKCCGSPIETPYSSMSILVLAIDDPACDKSLAIDSRVIATGLLYSMIVLIGTGDSGTVLTGFRESPATSMGLDNHLTSSLSGFNDSETILTLKLLTRDA